MNWKYVIAAVFTGSIVTANLTASKLAFFDLPIVGGTAVPAGFVAIGVAFLASDLLGELYGRETAHSVVNGSVVALAVAWGLVYVSVLLPTAPFYGAAEAFRTVMLSSMAIVSASVVTMLFSQNVDVYVFHRLREATGGRHKWVRNVGSTTVSQLIDTALFIVLGFAVFPHVFGGTVTPLAAIPSLVFAQYLVKLVVVGLDTPVFYLVTALAD